MAEAAGFALRAERLAARYPGQPPHAPALADLTLRLRPGERVLLLGPNGAGKSTLIRLAAGLMRPARGQVTVHEQPAHQARRLVGVVGHATYLYPELSTAENLRFYGRLYGVAAPGDRAAQLLERAGLRDLADERVARLSRGQQQRVALARALLHDPPVLLLDEPDTGLDQAALPLLEELALDSPRTLLLTTHNLAAGLRLGSRVVVLARGRAVHEQAGVSARDAHALADLLRRLAQPGAGPA